MFNGEQALELQNSGMESLGSIQGTMSSLRCLLLAPLAAFASEGFLAKAKVPQAGPIGIVGMAEAVPLCRSATFVWVDFAGTQRHHHPVLELLLETNQNHKTLVRHVAGA